jgi:capsid protein
MLRRAAAGVGMVSFVRSNSYFPPAVPWPSTRTLLVRAGPAIGARISQLTDAMLVRAKVAALHAGFMTDADGTPPYDGDRKDSTLDVSLEPGAMMVLPPGKSVEFPNAPDQGNAAAIFDGTLRMIAAGAGVTFEQLTGDYSKVNYSSARAALLEFVVSAKASNITL